jgi:molecular chaperone DnaJ
MMAAVQFKDYYDVLGVERAADDSAIRSAYRTLARKLHPDVNRDDPDAEDRFKEVNEAYEVLSDAEKRRMYDRFGRDWQRYRDAGFTGESGPRPGPGRDDFATWFTGNAQPGPTGESNGRFSDFFDLLFGNAADRRSQSFQRQARPLRGEDSELEVDVSLDEAFSGTTRRVTLATPTPCKTCGGSGLARGTTCPTCDGSGQVATRRTIEVNIPPGVRTGSRVRAAGQGAAGRNGGPNGDVYLRIRMRDDARFTRNGDDLSTTVDVPLYTALLGGEVIVPTPTGRVALTIPAETQNGRTFRLRGKGMPRLGGQSRDADRGDLLVTAALRIPTNLTDQERALLRDLRNLRQ